MPSDLTVAEQIDAACRAQGWVLDAHQTTDGWLRWVDATGTPRCWRSGDGQHATVAGLVPVHHPQIPGLRLTSDRLYFGGRDLPPLLANILAAIAASGSTHG